LIANNYGELMSVPLYESALMGAALILLLVVLIFNVLARLSLNRQLERAGQ
jgi:phosphate transport system permease protein